MHAGCSRLHPALDSALHNFSTVNSTVTHLGEPRSDAATQGPGSLLVHNTLSCCSHVDFLNPSCSVAACLSCIIIFSPCKDEGPLWAPAYQHVFIQVGQQVAGGGACPLHHLLRAAEGERQLQLQSEAQRGQGAARRAQAKQACE